jgi:hypothetical protein
MELMMSCLSISAMPIAFSDSWKAHSEWWNARGRGCIQRKFRQTDLDWVNG